MTKTFVDALSICEQDGHDSVYSEIREPKQFLYEKTETCNNCNLYIVWQKYKYMGWHEVE